MEIQDDLIEELIGKIGSDNLEFKIEIKDKSFVCDKVTIAKAITPVTKRTERGGVYFSDVEIFRIKAQIKNKEIIPLISKVMLGPNTEFADIKVSTNAKINDNQTRICFHTNLTNSMENLSFVELSLTINETETS